MARAKHYFPEISFVVLIVVVTVLEILLVQKKFNVFDPGFLQPLPLTTYQDQAIFVSLILFFNLVIYGTFFSLWQCLFVRLGQHRNLVALNFTLLATAVTIVALVAQFQLHKYFADAVDAQLLTEIAGGSLKDALTYASNEIILFSVGCAGLLLICVLLYRISRPILQAEMDSAETEKRRGHFVSKLIIVLLILTPFLMLLVNTRGELLHNLRRTNSFNVASIALDQLSDVDRDGYGIFKVPADASAFDSTIHPGALDIPNNGIDEDGLFGDFRKDTTGPERADIDTRIHSKKNVVLVVLESTRADVVGKEIDGVPVTPSLNGLIQSGVSVDGAYSHTGYTTSSLVALFNGALATDRNAESLFSIFKKNDYDITVFSGQDESFGGIDEQVRMKSNADFFFDAQVGAESRVYATRLPGGIQVSEATLLENFNTWSDQTDWSEPKFLYFNFQAAHFPYFHGKMTRRLVESGIPRDKIGPEQESWLRQTYLNAVNYADKHVGDVIGELKKKGVWENTLFIVTSDHGEELFDDGHLGHGFLLSDVQTRVPLIVNRPDFEVSTPTGHVDLKHNILKYLQTPSTIGDASGAIANQIESLSSSESEPFVFQFVGHLHNPNKIGFRYPDDRSIILDLRSMLVRSSASATWEKFDDAVQDQDTRKQLESLVIFWENQRWLDWLAESQPDSHLLSHSLP